MRANSNLHQWGAVTLFHGLPSDHVRAIAQGPDGVMWFGTDAGLAKYDGRRVQKIAADGPAAGRVRALRLDAEGVLWIGGDGGAARLINGEVKTIPETQGRTVTAIITPGCGSAVMVTEQGEIFDCSTKADGSIAVRTITTRDSQLLAIESRGDAAVQLTSLASIGNRVIVGSRSRGLLSVDLYRAENSPARVSEILSHPRPFFVETIETDDHGHLWFGAQTSSGESGVYDGTDLERPIKLGAGTGTVTAIKRGERGELWVGSDASGVFVFRNGRKVEHFTFENTAGGLRSNRINSIFIDREGVVWFGSDRGACRYDPRALTVETISGDPESNFARTLFRSSDGTLWCGTNKGLFARVGGGWSEVPELSGRVIHSIAEDPGSRLLIGTATGLFAATKQIGGRAARSIGRRVFARVDPSGSPDNIRAIEVFRGAVYIAHFDRGIERLDGSQRTLVWPDESANARQREVVSVHAGRDHLCIGTAEAGVFFFDGKVTQTNPALDALIGGGVWSMAGSLDDVLWLATARGLYAFKSGELLPIIERVDARWVVTETTRGAWCATVGGGLCKALIDESATTASVITSKTDAEQGLPSQNVFALFHESTNEGVWVGTNRGIARYQPATSTPVINATRVMAKRVYGLDEVRAGLNLEYPQNSLALEVAAMSSRTFPEQFQYSFLVSDSRGRPVAKKLSGESQLLIQGLRPGRYVVEARAFSHDLIASDPIRVEFTVASAPFPWTSTALSLLLALALVAMWWGYRQNKRLVRTNVALARTRIQLANETETERRRIARDLHDQTLADLRRLMLLTDQLPAAENNGHAKPSQIREKIESVSTEIRRICEDLSPSALANVGLTAALEWALADAVALQPPEKRFEYKFVSEPGIEERLKIEPAAQIQIFRIVQEALSNVCRHSSASHVTLTVAVDVDRNLTVQLEDDGCGFDPRASVVAGRGLTNIRSRASLIDASVSWRASRSGTLFSLRRPNT